MRTATLERKRLENEQSRYYIDSLKDLGKSAVGVLTSPVISMVTACVVIELIQNIPVWKGKYTEEWVASPDQDNPHHDLVKTKVKEPLLSNTLANGLELAITGSSIGGIIGGLLK
jgi:hypothetical protein